MTASIRSGVEPTLRWSPRITANELREGGVESKESVVELDDEVLVSAVRTPFIVQFYTDYGVVREKKDSRVDDLVTTTYKVEFLNWSQSVLRRSARLNGESEWLEEDDFKRVENYATAKDTYYVIAMRKKATIAKILMAQNTLLTTQLNTGANFALDLLLDKVAHAYCELGDTRWDHHTHRRRVICCTALLKYVSPVILARARRLTAQMHDGWDLFQGGDKRGLFHRIRLRNEGVAVVLGDDAAVRLLGRHWLKIYNVLLI